MESYPGEVLLGVFPLIFCVDATLSKESTGLDMEESAAVEEQEGQGRLSSASSRSQFDKFLDAMAASLMEEPIRSIASSVTHVERRSGSDRVHRDHQTHHHANNNNPMSGLFRGGTEDPEQESDAEDEIIMGSGTNDDTGKRNSVSSRQQQQRLNSLAMKMMRVPGLGSTPGRARRNHSLTSELEDSDNNTNNNCISIDEAFGAALQQGQSFFQRARIVSVSTRYGFPPSKDPTGLHNRVNEYMNGQAGSNHSNSALITNRDLSLSRLFTAIQKRPVDGILPSGWLEKHAAALPSVILIVLPIKHQTQAQQDQYLQDTLRNLHYSLAHKRLRNMSIHIVGLIQDGVSDVYAEQWAQTMTERLAEWEASRESISANNASRSTNGQPPITISLVPVEDLQPEAPYNGSALQHLQDLVRSASLAYYKAQTKNVKKKLIRLGSSRMIPVLLPLAIRYCFKVAVFYEFQWKQDKSLKYMCESYRLLELYFRYLLQRREVETDVESQDGNERATADGGDLPPITTSNSDAYGAGEGVELYLGSANDGNDEEDFIRLQSIIPAEDMIFQCRFLADWMNFKILQSSLVSCTAGGLLAASAQWQRHTQAFLCPRRSFIDTVENPWMDWSFVARQHIVLGQLLERYPPRLSGLSDEIGLDEALLRFAPGRSYEGAAEALLKTGYLLKDAKESRCKERANEARTRYIGGLDHEGLDPILREERKIDHAREALMQAQRGISFVDSQSESIDEAKGQRMSIRKSGARLRYLAGGALLKLSRTAEALLFLEDAASLCKGWEGLERAVARMLVHCLQKVNATLENTRATLTVTLLRACFALATSGEELRSALEKLAIAIKHIENADAIPWHADNFGKHDFDSPLAITATYPRNTHAIAGEDVTMTLWIKSKLRFAVQVDSITVLGVAGPFVVPIKDLQSARNASESSGGIIIQSHAMVQVTTKMKVPDNLELISDLDATSTTDASFPGKNVFQKSARPRAAGITSGAGCRFLPEGNAITRNVDQKSQKSPSSSNCLGGKPLRLKGVKLTLSSMLGATKVELNLALNPSQSDSKTPRASFEVDNYLSSAWTRPQEVPLKQGPLCLRILPPLPRMRVSDITVPLTSGIALEGTVNRFVVQMTAGPGEICNDVTIRLTYSTSIHSEEIVEMNPQDLLSENTVDRPPMLVQYKSCSTASKSLSHCELPFGWAPLEEATSFATAIDSDASTYMYFDIYRPAGDVGVTSSVDCGKICRTDIVVSVVYQQSGKVPSRKIQSRGRGKKNVSQGEEEIVTRNDVSVDHTVSVVWKPPISVSFTQKRPYPLSMYEDPSMTLCILQASSADVGLKVNVDRVEFTAKQPVECSVSNDGRDVILFDGTFSALTNELSVSSQMSLVWPSNLAVNNGFTNDGSLTSDPASISINWHPSPLSLSENVVLPGVVGDFEFCHGPLKLNSPCVCHARVPALLNDQSPFEVRLSNIPDHLEVAVPFEVVYTVSNNTALDQEIEIHQEESSTENETLNSVLFGGQSKGTVSLGPFESFLVSFIMIPTKIGAITLPPVSIWSKRYKTWVVRDDLQHQIECFAMP